MRILITGGLGFVGSALGRLFTETGSQVTALDNFRRRGAELNRGPLEDLGVSVVHGDVRNPADLEDLPGNFDLLLDAAAEPSVLSGTTASGPRYVLDSNLVGTIHSLEFARRRCAGVIFLSTSRVYSIPALRGLPLRETPSRFELVPEAATPGCTLNGISESFPVNAGFRSFYGTSKLASEMLVEEYAQTFRLPAVVNRCGVIAGPGQFGKTDQGIFSLWAARHVYGGPLRYTGFGGTGKQVRDLLHPQDLFRLIREQLSGLALLRGQVVGVGGGHAGAVSLREYSRLCREATGNDVNVESCADSAAVDIPYYVTDHARASRMFNWRPEITPLDIVTQTVAWLARERAVLEPLFRT